MAVKRLTLNFPPQLIDQPITYRLARDYDLVVNILRARVTPLEEGRLVVEITGKKKNLDAGLNFLQEIGLEVKPLAQDIRWREERCIECSACTSICPTGALSLIRPEMRVAFLDEKCIACELCIATCPYKAMEIVF
ncbi:MAG: NIL domain-containing protein [Syntrophobacteraceae bacterium]